MLIDGAGDQFLAAAAFTADQHGDILRSNTSNGLVDVLHRHAASDHHVAGLAGRLIRLAERHWFAHQTPHFECPVDEFANLPDVERLGQVVERPELHGIDRRRTRATGRDKDDRQPRIDLLDLPQQVQPRPVWQHEVEDAGIRSLLTSQFQALTRILSRQHFNSVLLERTAKELQHGWLVIHNQQSVPVHQPAFSIRLCDQNVEWQLPVKITQSGH